MRMPVMGWRTLLLLAQFIVPGAGCRPAPNVASAPARVDLASEERAIRDAEARWREMMRRRDTAAIGSFYTEDAVYAPEDRPPARGRDAVAAMWATNELTLGDVMLERTPTRIEVARSGDVATEVGTWVFRGTHPDDKRVEGRGNYLTAWRKVEGEWKTSAYLWNFGETGRAPR
jgi:ketosteroid isomerase-like protein